MEWDTRKVHVCGTTTKSRREKEIYGERTCVCMTILHSKGEVPKTPKNVMHRLVFPGLPVSVL